MTIEGFKRLQPCDKGLEYVEEKGSVDTAWYDCDRGDWMLWYAHRLGVDPRKITLVKVEFIRAVEQYIDDGGETDRVFEMAERYALGEGTEEGIDLAYEDACSWTAHCLTNRNAPFALIRTFSDYRVPENEQEWVLTHSADLCRKILSEDVLQY